LVGLRDVSIDDHRGRDSGRIGSGSGPNVFAKSNADWWGCELTEAANADVVMKTARRTLTARLHICIGYPLI